MVHFQLLPTFFRLRPEQKGSTSLISSFLSSFITTLQNSLYVTVCIIVSSLPGYIILSLSTLHYCNAPRLTKWLTGDYHCRTCTDWNSPAYLDAPVHINREKFFYTFLAAPLAIHIVERRIHSFCRLFM